MSHEAVSSERTCSYPGSFCIPAELLQAMFSLIQSFESKLRPMSIFASEKVLPQLFS